MNAENDIKICISPRQGKITIEEQEGLVLPGRKSTGRPF